MEVLIELLVVLALVIYGLLLMVGSGPKLANRFIALILRAIWRVLQGILGQLWRLGGRLLGWLWRTGWRTLREILNFLIRADREASRRWPRGTIVFYVALNAILVVVAVVIFLHFFV